MYVGRDTWRLSGPTLIRSITKVIEGILTFETTLEHFLVWEIGVLTVALELYRQDNYKGKTHLNDVKKNKRKTQCRKEVGNRMRCRKNTKQ